MLMQCCLIWAFVSGALPLEEQKAYEALDIRDDYDEMDFDEDLMEEGDFFAVCNGYCIDREDCHENPEVHHIHYVQFEEQTINSDHIQLLKKFSFLESMNFINCDFQEGLDFEFESWPKLEDLTIYRHDNDVALSPNILNQIVKSKSIVRINAQISPDDYSVLAQSKSIKTLKLELDRHTDLRPLLPLRHQILELSISITEEPPENLSDVLNQFTALRILRLYSASVDDAFVKSIQKMNLAILWLIDTNITDKSVSTLEKWSSLNDICIYSLENKTKITSKGEEALRQISNKKVWFQTAPLARGWEDLTPEELK